MPVYISQCPFCHGWVTQGQGHFCQRYNYQLLTYEQVQQAIMAHDLIKEHKLTSFREVSLKSVLEDELAFSNPLSCGEVLSLLRKLRAVRDHYKANPGTVMLINSVINSVREYAKTQLTDTKIPVSED